MPSLFTDPPPSVFTTQPSRLEQLQQLLTPEWAKPFAGMSAEQANREAQILASGKQAPGKIGPGYLSDTQRLGMAAGDVASLIAPEAKAGMAAAIPPGLFQAARKALPISGAHEALTAVAHDRAQFDPLLRGYETTYTASELKDIAKGFTGYDVGKTKKADIIKAMHNWQREAELNNDIHAAMTKDQP